MKVVVFGLAISSSWGNGHATLWRALARGLAEDGHELVFFERDLPFYAPHRDKTEIDGGRLHLFAHFADVGDLARRELGDADAAIVTSYCPDARAATEIVIESDAGVRAFYDMDTPVTLERLRAGEDVAYVPASGLGAFDVVMSFTGGPALDALREMLGARRVAPLYGCVDPDAHAPARPCTDLSADLSYLGTYAADRQQTLERLFLAPARALPDRRFLIGGAQYPADFPWAPNVFYRQHVRPVEHPAFYCSSPLTLNVTRSPMAAMGHCPSGRLFEAAACGTPVVSDVWAGLDEFFEPDAEILIADSPEDVVQHLSMSDGRRAAIAAAARDRVLRSHTGLHRAREMIDILEDARSAEASSRTSTRARANGGR